MKPIPRPALPRTEELIAHPLARVFTVFALLYVFLLGVNGLGSGFKLLGADLLETFFSATSNPFVGLMVGVLATTLVQSSSVTTSLIVGLVAAPENPLPVANAVPMVMGANIGTTVTNTIVSLAHAGRREEFRRAFAVATCHDFFNFMAVAILLPLEMLTGYLRDLAGQISSAVTGIGGVKYDSPIKSVIKAGVGLIQKAIGAVTDSEKLQAVLLIVVSGIMIYAALLLLVRTMRSLVQKRVELVVSRALDRKPLLAMLVGMVVTVMVQSSSITTSLLVPLAGAALITLAQAFPVTVGANIGTTVTALLASLAATGQNAQAGVTIALVHLLFNLSATAIIYPVERIRNIPLSGARKLADIAVDSRWWALAYVVLLFYVLPAALAALNRYLG
jgi:sodium-dependent phosphate cotransporter